MDLRFNIGDLKILGSNIQSQYIRVCWGPLPAAGPLSVFGTILARSVFQLVGSLPSSEIDTRFCFDTKVPSSPSRIPAGNFHRALLAALPHLKLMKQLEKVPLSLSNCMSSVVTCVWVTQIQISSLNSIPEIQHFQVYCPVGYYSRISNSIYSLPPTKKTATSLPSFILSFSKLLLSF